MNYFHGSYTELPVGMTMTGRGELRRTLIVSPSRHIDPSSILRVVPTHTVKDHN